MKRRKRKEWNVSDHCGRWIKEERKERRKGSGRERKGLNNRNGTCLIIHCGKEDAGRMKEEEERKWMRKKRKKGNEWNVSDHALWKRGCRGK